MDTYHTKKYTVRKLLWYSEDQEKKVQKAMKKRGLNKSELLRELIDSL